MRVATGSGGTTPIAGVRGLVALLVLALMAAACGASDASAPAPTVPVNGPGGGSAVVGGDGPTASVGGSAAAWAGMLPALLGAPKRPPIDPLALLALLLQPWREPYKTGPNPNSPVVTAPFALPEGDGTVYAVGDSVLLGTRDPLTTALGGWDLRLDARVGRTMPEGLDVIDQNRASIGQAMIICLGHNYGGGGKFIGYLDQLMAMTRKAQRVVVMTVAEWSPAQVEVNRAVRALPQLYANVVVADWQAVLAANPQFLTDNVHLTRAGSTALANLLAVMLGPARPNGRTVPPPRILDLPADGPSAPSKPSPTSTTTTSTTTTTTSVPASSTTTTVAPTSTTAVTTTTTTPTTEP